MQFDNVVSASPVDSFQHRLWTFIFLLLLAISENCCIDYSGHNDVNTLIDWNAMLNEVIPAWAADQETTAVASTSTSIVVRLIETYSPSDTAAESATLSTLITHHPSPGDVTDTLYSVGQQTDFLFPDEHCCLCTNVLPLNICFPLQICLHSLGYCAAFVGYCYNGIRSCSFYCVCWITKFTRNRFYGYFCVDCCRKLAKIS